MVLIVDGLVVFAGAWLAGPARLAVAARRRLAPAVRTHMLWTVIVIYALLFLLMTLSRSWWTSSVITSSRAGPKAGWLIFLLVLPIIGALVYLIARGQAWPSGRMSSSRRPGPSSTPT